jgi:hypothetical protein
MVSGGLMPIGDTQVMNFSLLKESFGQVSDVDSMTKILSGLAMHGLAKEFLVLTSMKTVSGSNG